jgi:lipopolysaccharide/colanic/teichoic acid biosynthesis glycosyltransferase
MNRLLDYCFALFVFIGLSWLLILIWLAVKLTSRGPGVLAQARVGQEQQIFTCWKFRTMYSDTHQVGTHEVSALQITPLGHILRRSKIDELPQAVNILRGEMALVGPRPCLSSQNEVIRARAAQGVFSVRPGITGLAQIEGVDMSTPDLLAARDATYIAKAGLCYDFAIVWATFRGKGLGDRVRNSTNNE